MRAKLGRPTGRWFSPECENADEEVSNALSRMDVKMEKYLKPLPLFELPDWARWWAKIVLGPKCTALNSGIKDVSVLRPFVS